MCAAALIAKPQRVVWFAFDGLRGEIISAPKDWHFQALKDLPFTQRLRGSVWRNQTARMM